MFQAAALVMADLRVLKDQAFLGVAMTAQQWVPLLQVAQRDLLPWLTNKRAQGYRCAALLDASDALRRSSLLYNFNSVSPWRQWWHLGQWRLDHTRQMEVWWERRARSARSDK